MYETASVLEYQGRKIWVKQIADMLYCVNGKFVLFSKKQDLNDVKAFVDGIDWFYSPWFGDLSDDMIIAFCDGSDNTFNMGSFPLQEDKKSKAFCIRDEYDLWFMQVKKSDIYINDCRNMDVGDWIMRGAGRGDKL